MRRLLIASLLLTALLGFGATRVVANQQGPSKPVWTHVVQPGETLWQLAREAAPRIDTRRTVDRLIETNDLRGGRIIPGQKLILYAR